MISWLNGPPAPLESLADCFQPKVPEYGSVREVPWCTGNGPYGFGDGVLVFRQYFVGVCNSMQTVYFNTSDFV